MDQCTILIPKEETALAASRSAGFGRLAAYLLYLSEQEDKSRNLELSIKKSQLASLLGTIPETLSRILGKMAGQGLIKSDGPRIKILDRERLEELAEWGGHLK